MTEEDLKVAWYAGREDGTVTVIQGLQETPLPHHKKHSSAGWRFEPLDEVKLDVAIRAQQLEVLRMPADFDGVGLKPAGAPTPEGVVPLLLVSGVDVVEVQGGSASVVATTLALAAEELDKLRALSALTIPQAFLIAWPTASYIPLGPGVREGLAAIGAESGWLQFNAGAVMGTVSSQSATTRLTTPLVATGSAELSLAVGAVRDGVTARFAIQRWVGFHHSMVQAREESPFGWGYSGSGPAELARCMLIHALGPESKCTVCDGTGQIVYGPEPDGEHNEFGGVEMSVAKAESLYTGEDVDFDQVFTCPYCEDGIAVTPRMYQQFKFDVIARLPAGEPWRGTEATEHDGVISLTPTREDRWRPWSMPQSEVLDWVSRYRLGLLG